MRMSLGSIQTGKVARPVRVLLHGTEGVGKSTFASHAPSPIFLCSEDGTSELDVARFPEPLDFAEAQECIDVLSKEEHPYRTLVIDSVDWLEPLIWRHVCTSAKRESMEDFPYQSGYNVAFELWRQFIFRVEKLRESRKMHTVLIAHSVIKTFSDPESDSYDRYELKLHKKAAGLLKEWSDAVLFAKFDSATRKDGDKTKGVSTGTRVMFTERRAAFDAKNRYNLPFKMNLSWKEFQAGIQASRQQEETKK